MCCLFKIFSRLRYKVLGHKVLGHKVCIVSKEVQNKTAVTPVKLKERKQEIRKDVINCPN